MDSKSAAVLLGACLLVAASVRAEERPDFSGIWRAARPARPPATNATNNAPQANAPATTRIGGWPTDPPLKPEAKAKIDEYRALVSEQEHAPGEFCLGSGMPSSMLGSGGYPMEIIQRPEQITVIYEAHTELRRIYTGGQKFNLDDIFPSRNGFSIGRWEGDTLVVETSKLKEQVDTSTAHSEQAHIIERYRLSKDQNGNRILTAEMTMTDPGFYRAPITVTKTWQAAEPGTFMMYYECNEPDWLDFVDKLREEAAKKKNAGKQ